VARNDRGFVPALGFDRLTSVYDPVVALTTRESRFKKRVLELAKIGEKDAVLDLACGTGTLAIQAKRLQPKARVTGLDADPVMLMRAEKKAKEAGVEIDFERGLSGELPWDGARFDVVLSTLFFHHLADEVKRDTAEEIRRVLRPGGRLVVADWGRAQDPLMRLAFLPIQLLDGFSNTSGNVRGRLPEMLRDCGLRQVKVCDRIRTPFGTIEVLIASRPAR
jgi:ubiquinone/menaquinone biosynthesis C-methylase UbiE